MQVCVQLRAMATVHRDAYTPIELVYFLASAARLPDWGIGALEELSNLGPNRFNELGDISLQCV